MGYYVRGDGEFTIKTSNIANAYQALCDLNQRDDLKRGGRHGGENDCTKPRPSGMNHHPGRWFSWMDADYPDKLATLDEILSAIGFDFRTETEGDLTHFRNVWYDNKMGQEEEFFTALAPFVTSGEIRWTGEENNHWAWRFEGGTLRWLDGEITYTYTTP